jgi:hypothetical protein
MFDVAVLDYSEGFGESRMGGAVQERTGSDGGSGHMLWDGLLAAAFLHAMSRG